MSAKITLDQLKEHTKKDSFYALIHGKVYDVTKFLDEHPGGDEVIMAEGGKDATEAFEDVGHSDEARDILKGLYVADFEGGPVSAPKITPSPSGKSSSSDLEALPISFLSLPWAHTWAGDSICLIRYGIEMRSEFETKTQRQKRLCLGHPSSPLDNKESQSSAEKAPSASHLTASQGQTLSFSLDDAFDDKSAPTTPSFFSANKFPSGSTFGGAINGSDAPADDGFGEFDDFAAPVSGQVTDDDFGEFGDFGDGGDGGGFGEVVGDGFGNDGFGTASLETPAHWQPLTVDPLPPPNELSELVQELMGPCWASLRPDDLMSDEPERQVEGLARILVTSER
ncbi:cytochrome b5 [Rhizoctonia solani]|uniref:Cytochrome b5 n=1 Tax=Rhizoctonia solani TaxID=456999 RepID=A0A8H8STL9_9AGAM|nr:cytochrome b5 [Rhizoctonia solani]QRW16198.1 cytochrome b5 [Rhizoctonia solani]